MRASVLGGSDGEVARQAAVFPRRDERSFRDATRHLPEEGERDARELLLEPVVGRRIQVLVEPQGRETASVGEADLLADSVVALVVREGDEKGDEFRRKAGGREAPPRIELVRQEAKDRQGESKLELRKRGNHGMERDGIADDRGHLRHQPGHGGHHEARRSLAMNHGLDAARCRFAKDGLDRLRMVVEGGLVEGPRVRRQVDAGPPVLEPDVVTVLDQKIDERRFDRRAEDVGSDSGAVNEHHRSPPGMFLPADVNQIAGEAVPGDERDDPLRPGAHVFRYLSCPRRRPTRGRRWPSRSSGD